MKEKYYITTAIAYASKNPHIGNDYDPVVADAIARFKRLAGYEVFFLTGTDEHGQKIEETAREAGISPQECVDRVAAYIMENYKLLNISYDKFIRTTFDYHERAVQKIFTKLYESDDIYKDEYEGLYCVPCESFYTASQVTEESKCPACSATLKIAKETAYFFRLSKYQKWLEEHIENHKDFIIPESRRNEMLNNFIKPGLQDLCVTRSSINWGIPVEFDKEHKIYVWLDALSNYITALGYSPDMDDNVELFNKYWPCDLHVIGKDIVRFHTIYWPIFLKALGVEIPKQVYGHPWVLFGGEKMSKSTGNIAYSKDVVEKYGADALRYYLLCETPFAADSTFTHEKFVSRINTDLVNTLGNLVHRTITMVDKYFDGVIPSVVGYDALDEDLKNTALNASDAYLKAMNEYRVSDAIDAVLKMLHRANKYIDETTPWSLAKDENKKDRLGNVLYNLLESIRFGAIMLSPVIPEMSDKIFMQIGTEIRTHESLQKFNGTVSGNSVGKAEMLYARIEESEPVEEVTQPQTPEITIEEFLKTDIRVALVTHCEKLSKSDKLLILHLDLGYEKRQVVAGIAKFYASDDLIGKKILVVSNLKATKLKGIQSEGMILASGEDEVKVVFADISAEIGSRVH